MPINSVIWIAFHFTSQSAVSKWTGMKSEGCSNKKAFCHDNVPAYEISNFERHFQEFDADSHRTGSKETNSSVRKKMFVDAKNREVVLGWWWQRWRHGTEPSLSAFYVVLLNEDIRNQRSGYSPVQHKIWKNWSSSVKLATVLDN